MQSESAEASKRRQKDPGCLKGVTTLTESAVISSLLNVYSLGESSAGHPVDRCNESEVSVR